MKSSSQRAPMPSQPSCGEPKPETESAATHKEPNPGRPCQATANVVLGLLQTILEEKSQDCGGQLSMEEIRQVIGQFMEAPGQLKSFYVETQDQCRSSARSEEQAGFEAKIRALSKQEPGTATFGRLQLVGLQAVREKLGERWETALERVQAVAESVIRRRLSDSDSFRRGPDDDLIILFGELTGEEAWFKAKAIEQEIHERLIGCEGESVLEALDVDFATLSEAAEVASQTHDLDLPLADGDAALDLDSLVAKRLAQASQSMRQRAQDDFALLERRWRVIARPINVNSSAPARFAIADVDEKTHQILGRLLPVIRHEPEELVKLDLLALASAASFLGEEEQDQTLLAVTIHAASVIDGAALNHFSKACVQMSPALRDRLILVLDDLPDDWSPAAMAEVLRRLRDFSRLQALKLKLPRLDGQHLRAARVPLLMANYAPTAALLRREPQQLRGFLADLRDSGTRLLVDRVPKPEAVEPLLAAGVELWSLKGRS